MDKRKEVLDKLEDAYVALDELINREIGDLEEEIEPTTFGRFQTIHKMLDEMLASYRRMCALKYTIRDEEVLDERERRKV